MKRSPRSVVEIDVLEVDGEVYFHRFFCALKPCIDGFLEGCRPHLSIDATILNGRWNDHLAIAIALMIIGCIHSLMASWLRKQQTTGLGSWNN